MARFVINSTVGRNKMILREKLAWSLLFTLSMVYLFSSRHPILQDNENKYIKKEMNIPIFHGGSPLAPAGSLLGSCWCGSDNYCMCNPSLAIDLVLIEKDENEELYVWLVRRSDTNQLATMGGFVNVGETTENAVSRELMEEMKIAFEGSPTLLGLYSDPTRDKRRHTASAVYHARIKSGMVPYAGDDAKDVVRLKLEDVTKKDPSEFFADHYTILADYIHSHAQFSTTLNKSSTSTTYASSDGSAIRSLCNI